MPDITIGRLRGRYAASWYIDSPDGRKRRRFQLHARTRKEAEAEAIDVWNREHLTGDGLTIAGIWEAYRVDLGERPTAKTMQYTGRAVLPFMGALRPDQLDVDHSREYRAHRRAQGRAQGTIHTELGHLRSALKWARARGLIDQVPYVEPGPKPDSDVRPLSPAELSRIVNECNAPHLRTAVVLLATTAARVGAILDLTWDRVDFVRGVINLRLPDGVTRKGRAAVPMNKTARTVLLGAKARAETGYVIEYNAGPVKSIRNAYTKAVARAGVPDANIHQIRHSAAVAMLAEGVDVHMVSQMLGHANVAITLKIYARFMPHHMRGAADTLELPKLREMK